MTTDRELDHTGPYMLRVKREDGSYEMGEGFVIQGMDGPLPPGAGLTVELDTGSAHVFRAPSATMEFFFPDPRYVEDYDPYTQKFLVRDSQRTDSRPVAECRIRADRDQILVALNAIHEMTGGSQ